MARRTPLTPEALAAALLELPAWSGGTDGIERTVEFPDFRSAVEALEMIVPVADGLNHHPDVDLRYGTLRLVLVTHSAGAVTERDVQLARGLDEVFAELAEAATENAGPPSPQLQEALDAIDRQLRKAARRAPDQPGSGA
jgi:4a-hydroxytetrahydrobiopterin dehydratase